MNTTAASALYWKVVGDCLVEIFHKPQDEASRLIVEAKARLEASSMAYHREPLDTAAQIVGEEPRYDEVHSIYSKLQAQLYPIKVPAYRPREREAILVAETPAEPTTT